MTDEYVDSLISDLPSASRSSSSPESTLLSTPCTTPPASPEPFTKGGLDLFSSTFLPASLCDDSARDGPPLPDAFPQLSPNVTPEVVAELDRDTPDNWVKRNPDLIRLTGKHPFNCEARLSSLFDAGFLTPAHLHYVRNHGAVPRVSEQMAVEWTLHIHGLVQREATFTLQQLSETFPVVTLPVTFVCAGNRRKEQNVVKKTLGFSWGAAGLSTALWTGVYLADVLAYVKPIRREAKHIVFEGADNLPNGPYGTSQLLSWAADKNKGMLLAWAMNGLPLEPDHGFPLRVVIPGQIGGRSVKWLKRIEISNGESQHHLHYWDNKLLPSQLMPDQARAEKHWWYDPRYLITELNVNSAIAKPDHNETLVVAKHLPPGEVVPSYSIRGYAYTGGGRRVTRVEVSLDEGTTWVLADIEYPEDRFRQFCHEDPTYGTLDLSERDTSFCWCFWSFDVKYDALATCNALAVRASDESSTLQPRDMYWHSLGMMNNWWFRVAVNKAENENEIVLQFEHPTLAGTAAGGWMEQLKASGQDITKPVFGTTTVAETPNDVKPKVEEVPLTKPGVTRKITVEELKKQDRAQPWFVVNGEVYDGTPFLNEHPGGSDSITLVAGEDASEDFFAIHSAEGKAKLAQFHIGTLVKSGAESADSDEQAPDAPFLERAKWKDVKLTRIVQVNHDSFLYLFELPRPDQLLGLPVGQHVFVRLKRKDTGEVVQRAYTPVSREGAVGSIEFLIKLYLPPAHSPGGKMTTGFHQLKLGDTVQLKGPLGSFTWNGLGVANWKGSERKVKEVGMICGGSGITPILQVLRSIFNDAGDTETRVWVISANRNEEDILCRDELDRLFAQHGPHRLKLHYILSKPPATWTGGTGRIDEKLLKIHMPDPSEHGMVLVCGPDPMINQAVKPGLKVAGWDIEKCLVVF
ncbi:hypothetical protein EDC04DRAFT_3056554 [Pisolithus marmoratus]|nr:hypothetical protein EDC04DRAFT_3056554 [Pisolithus marmoratus]